MKTQKPQNNKGTLFETSSEIIRVPIDYSNDIQKMVDSGNYDRTSLLIFAKPEEIKPKYEIGVRDYHMKILSINKFCTPKEVLTFIEKVSPSTTWKPARIEHLLALGSQMPQEQIEHQIIALGTPIILGDGLNFPRLEYLYHERGLSPVGIGEINFFPPSYKFLIYRES